MKSAFSLWLSAIRPKTLPLASAAIFLASAIAFRDGYFQWTIFLLAIITAVLLQVISNLANDYGDSITGADDDNRVGPTRVMQAGLVSPQKMKRALTIAILMATVCGGGLLYLAIADNIFLLGIFLLLGALSVVAAITYTMGDSPYGYSGFGDISVYIFFGLVAVIGGYVLYSHQFYPLLLLPASFCGLLCASVLNVNNLRDLPNDKQVGKNTLVVRLGYKYALIYHWLLFIVTQCCAMLYIVLDELPVLTWLHVLALPILIKSAIDVRKYHDGELMNKQLKITVIGAFLYCALFSLGLIY